ncbi:septum site-determining protein MinC [Pseudoduganella violaceinigra]|uniref:septum site-determining protein MinC n=1 Tax=Pseudoduganella violaceinigra TaxID=246602 RepID=UPI000419CC6D|nr:septum site-determining protein MinC [Pseudoduganella violaceinigra]
MPKSKFQKPIEIKISTVVAVSTIMYTSDLATLDAAMHEMTGGVSDFFEGDLAVIDVGDLAPGGERIDWAATIALLKKYRLNPVAVRNAKPEMVEEIQQHGLQLDSGKREEPPIVTAPKPAPAPAPAPAPVAAPAAPAFSGTMIIDTPVRAGQRIYARGGDLIVMAVVNNGAEIIADGSIHVYNTLNGRALAGASGNASARIFALSMSPELVSIAGVYRTFEDGFPTENARKPVQIRLNGDSLEIQSVNSAK